MKQIFHISDISAVNYLPLSRGPSREEPAQVQVLGYIPDMYIVKNERRISTTRPPPRLVYPPRKRQNQVIKVRYLYASSCEYLPKQSIIPPPSSSLLLVQGSTSRPARRHKRHNRQREHQKHTLRSPMKGSHFSSYRVGPFVNQRNGGTKKPYLVSFESLSM